VVAAGEWAHLVSRFLGSLWPGGPSPSDEAWVLSVLSSREAELWRRMSGPDRRHAVGVARRVEAALGDRATAAVLAAALLHDVGKVAARLGVLGRVAATVAGRATGGRKAAAWSRRGGLAGRVGTYLRHAPIGGEMLEAAGSDRLTSDWAREHHLPPARWSLPPAVGSALKQADDD
jgi:hypothetical protein